MKLPIRISCLGLLESAPLLAADARGYFRDEKLHVELSCDLGVASICAKLVDNEIDGACLPAQMPVLLSLGAGTTKISMDAVLVTSSQDMAIVLAKQACLEDRKPRGTARALKIGVLGHSSPACHLVKRWKMLQPAILEEEPVFVSLAASQLIHFFEEGLIDGFCGPDPLPALACLCNGGVIAATSATLSPLHPGSVIALRSEFTHVRADLIPSLTRALRRAQTFCADTANHGELWDLVLAQKPFGHTSEAHRNALVRLSQSGSQGTPTILFHSGTKGAGLDDQGAHFIELACRASLGAGDRNFDLPGEIARVYPTAA